MAGFVYVMSNPGFDGRVKIGKSIKDPTVDRVDELNSTTSVPEPFKVEYYCYVNKFDELEASVHKSLEDYRPNKKREFFQIDLSKAVATIQEVARNLGDIKFEEFYFDQNISVEPTAAVEYILSQYPKAAKVLEYNATAKAYFIKLAAVPGNVTEDFLLVLENEPNISVNELDQLFDEPTYVRHFMPFDSAFANYCYDLCLQESSEMALAFKNDFELLSSSVSAKEIFIKLCNKYRVEVEKYDLDGASFFKSVSRKISSGQDITAKELKDLFSIIGLELYNIYGLYVIKYNDRVLLEDINLPDLLMLMKDGISVEGLLADADKRSTEKRQDNAKQIIEMSHNSSKSLNGETTKHTKKDNISVEPKFDDFKKILGWAILGTVLIIIFVNLFG